MKFAKVAFGCTLVIFFGVISLTNVTTTANHWHLIDKIAVTLTASTCVSLLWVFGHLIKIVFQTKQGYLIKIEAGTQTLLAIFLPVTLLLSGLILLGALPFLFSSKWLDLWIWAPNSVTAAFGTYLSFCLLLLATSILGSMRIKVDSQDGTI